MPDKYRVEILPSAGREVDPLRGQELARVTAAMDGLATNPRPRGCRELATSDSDYRLRVGDYSVLYEVSDPEERSWSTASAIGVAPTNSAQQ